MSQSSTSFNSYSNDNNGQKPAGDTDGVDSDYISKETNREGRQGGYGRLNGALSAPVDAELQHGSDDAYGRLRADRRDLSTGSNSRNEERDVLDHKPSVGFGRGPGARQIEGQQLLRRKF